MPRHRANQCLRLAGFSDGSGRGISLAGVGGGGNDASFPDMLDELVLADHTVGILREIEQQIEDLGLDMDAAGGAPELPPSIVGRKIIEFYQQLKFRPRVLREKTGKSNAKN